MQINFLSKRFKVLAALLAGSLMAYYFCLPDPLFKTPYSTVLEASNGELLSASIASDGQWRFPHHNNVPQRFAEAIVTYEDKRFWSHPGVDILSFSRAVKQNVEARKVVSGGSTLSMQVIRLSRKGKPRTIFEKIIEIILATRLELKYSKQEILALYTSHAPFGGNVVGLDAACWRYFGGDTNNLSWGEAAMLAVLPNAPSLIHPGKNRGLLKKKRDNLLDKLRAAGKIDTFTCTLAKEEPIPYEPHTLPRLARHLLTRLSNQGRGQLKTRSTIDHHLQQSVEQIVSDHHERLRGNQIHNVAAIVADVHSGNVLAYVGNASNKSKAHADDVDIVLAPRSTGSILKPFLYAAMLDEGKILPTTLLPDVPTFINGFSPKNFSQEYDGAVPADKALIRSLNIPAVHMLREYRYEKFHSLLKQLGMTTLNQAPDHYGLSLILGGAEGTLWDVAGMYASMARTLNNYFIHPGKNRYNRNDFRSLNFLPVDSSKNTRTQHLDETSWISAAAIYQTFDVLKEVYRPGEESGWRQFFSSKKIAWKTGTSFGFRDGWAVGVTPDYVVGIWIGNADGEGRPGLTGTNAAAPAMFDIFSQLEGSTWFRRPHMEMEKVTLCTKSGLRNTMLCENIDTVWATRNGIQSAACAYHKKVHLSSDKKYRVHSDCESITKMISANWFILPPVQEYYYRPKNLSYHSLPAFRRDCQAVSTMSSMDLIYPKPQAKIFIPRDLSGAPGGVVLQLAHRNPSSVVYWHIDDNFIGTTQKTHHLALNLKEGWHKLTLIDENGESLEQFFKVLSDM